jgi:hypothetical protein
VSFTIILELGSTLPIALTVSANFLRIFCLRIFLTCFVTGDTEPAGANPPSFLPHLPQSLVSKATDVWVYRSSQIV